MGVGSSHKWNVTSSGADRSFWGWFRDYSLFAQFFYFLASFLMRQKDSQKYLLITQGRSGSTYLSSLLSSHPEISCHMLAPRAKLFNYFRVIEGKSKFFPGNIFVHRLLSADTVKAQNSGSLDSLVAEFTDAGWQVIYLYREDVVSQALSALVSQKRQELGKKNRKARRGPFTIEAKEFVSKVSEVMQWNSMERKVVSSVPHFSIGYESELMHRYMDTSERLLKHFGLRPLKLKSPLSRNIIKDVTEDVANWEELAPIVDEKGWSPPSPI